MQLQGLETNTKYYAKGYFAKETAGELQQFGASELETFSTVPTLTSDQKAKLARLIQRGLITRSDIVVKIGGGTTTTTTTTEEAEPEEEEEEETTTTTTTTTTASTNTSSSTTTSSSNTYTRAQIQAKINALQAELTTWQQRLRNLSSGTTTTATSSFSSTRSTTPATLTNTMKNTGKSIRQLICEKLGRTNCK